MSAQGDLGVVPRKREDRLAPIDGHIDRRGEGEQKARVATARHRVFGVNDEGHRNRRQARARVVGGCAASHLVRGRGPYRHARLPRRPVVRGRLRVEGDATHREQRAHGELGSAVTLDSKGVLPRFQVEGRAIHRSHGGRVGLLAAKGFQHGVVEAHTLGRVNGSGERERVPRHAHVAPAAVVLQVRADPHRGREGRVYGLARGVERVLGRGDCRGNLQPNDVRQVLHDGHGDARVVHGHRAVRVGLVVASLNHLPFAQRGLEEHPAHDGRHLYVGAEHRLLDQVERRPCVSRGVRAGNHHLARRGVGLCCTRREVGRVRKNLVVDDDTTRVQEQRGRPETQLPFVDEGSSVVDDVAKDGGRGERRHANERGTFIDGASDANSERPGREVRVCGREHQARGRNDTDREPLLNVGQRGGRVVVPHSEPEGHLSVRGECVSQVRREQARASALHGPEGREQQEPEHLVRQVGERHGLYVRDNRGVVHRVGVAREHLPRSVGQTVRRPRARRERNVGHEQKNGRVAGVDARHHIGAKRIPVPNGEAVAFGRQRPKRERPIRHVEVGELDRTFGEKSCVPLSDFGGHGRRESNLPCAAIVGEQEVRAVHERGVHPSRQAELQPVIRVEHGVGVERLGDNRRMTKRNQRGRRGHRECARGVRLQPREPREVELVEQLVVVTQVLDVQKGRARVMYVGSEAGNVE